MADADPWAGLIDPRAALASFRREPKNFRRLSQDARASCESGYSTISEGCPPFSQFRSFRSPEVEPSQDRENSTKDRNKTCSSSISDTYALPAGLPDPEPACAGDISPAKAAKPRKYGVTHSDLSGSAFAATCESYVVTNTVPSPTAHLSGPPAWREGLARLDRWTHPCPGFRGHEWANLHRVIAHFMDHCAAEAFARGWTALDLFGVHRDAGAAAVDSCGALMLPWRRNASSLTAEVIAFGPLVYRRRALPEAVLAWDYAGGDWREEAP